MRDEIWGIENRKNVIDIKDWRINGIKCEKMMMDGNGKKEWELLYKIMLEDRGNMVGLK